MIERAIENWLIKTNERNYQAAFCQVLMHQGYRVLHSSVHGPMEHEPPREVRRQVGLSYAA